MKIKIIKKAVKILLRAFAVFITLLLIMLFALRFDTVQTGLAHIISGRLSSATGAEIKVDRLQIKLIKTLALQNLLVRDLHRDTLLFIPELDVSLSAFDYGMKTLDFNKITIENPRIYLGKHKGEEELNLQFMLDYFSSNDTAASALWHMEASEITITNGRFIFLDENAKGKRQQGIDYGDIAISHFNLLINDVLLDGDSMSAGLGNLSFKEHSGFELHSMNGIFSLTPRQIGIAGMKLAAGRSSLISDVSMHFGKFSDFNDFIHSVKMHVDIKQADIYTSDIAAFAPALYGADHRFRISGRVRGSVDRLRAKDLELQFGPNSYLKGDADITGLPVPDETFVMMKIRELLTNKRDLDSLPLPPFSQKRKLMLPPAFANLGRMTFSGDFTGFMNDFVAYGRFSTALGGISSDIQLYSDTLDGLMRYEGKMAMHNFDIGRLTGDQAGTLGKLSCTLNVQGTGTSAAHLQATLNGHISRLDLMQYSYSNMELKGRIDGKKFFGEGKMRDPNIALDFRGGVEMNPKQMFVQLDGRIKNARPTLLKLAKRDSTSSLSCNISASIRGNNPEDARGNIAITNLAYSEMGHSLILKKTVISSDSAEGNMKNLKLKTDLGRGSIRGDFDFSQLPAAVSTLLADVFPSYFSGHAQLHPKKQYALIDFQFDGLDTVTDIFSPSIGLPAGFTLNGELHGDTFNSSFNAAELALRGMRMYDVQTDISISDKIFNLHAGFGKSKLSRDVEPVDFEINMKAINDNLQFYSDWYAGDSTRKQNTLNGLGIIRSNSEFHMELSDSRIAVGDSIWVIDNGNSVDIDSTAIDIKGLSIGTGSSFFRADGLLSENSRDRLMISFSGFDLSYVNPFLNGLTLDGNIAGSASIANPYHGLVLNSDAEVTGMSVNSELIGDGRLSSVYESNNKRLKLLGNFSNGAGNDLRLMGNYYPSRAENSLDLDVDFEQFNLSIFKPFVNQVLSEMSGTASVKMKIRGTPARPELEGKLHIRRAEMLVDYLNTRYSVADASIFIQKDMIGFDAIQVTDEDHNKADVSGTILHNNFSDFNFDISVDAYNFKCLNTTAKDNSTYYGVAYLEGMINLSGYADNLMLDVTAATGKGSRLFIPMDEAQEVSENTFITFINKDTSAINAQARKRTEIKGIQMNFDLDITPEAEVQLIFDEKVGDILKARGRGNIEMKITTLGDFNILGQYEIEDGDYLFTLQNIINKKFLLEKGGSITWNGDPYNATLDITALYKLKAPLYDILQDSSYKKRVPVDCRLKMTGKLASPSIAFDIDLPKSDEKIQSDVASAIGTQEEMNKQVFTLLMLNRFKSPGGATSSANRVGIGSSTTSELLSNQLTNWLSQISNDFDIGVDYRPGDEISSQELDVALSTQLFNDRMILEGNIGMSDNNNTGVSGNNSVAGDFSLEYKITDDGKLRAKVYNESNDQNIMNTNTAKYTQGAGISYREEFDTFGEFLRKIFRKKKKEAQR